jgi:hypothetical protein
MRRQTSRPLSRGIMMSITATSKPPESASRHASSPLVAVVTVKPSRSNA